VCARVCVSVLKREGCTHKGDKTDIVDTGVCVCVVRRYSYLPHFEFLFWKIICVVCV